MRNIIAVFFLSSFLFLTSCENKVLQSFNCPRKENFQKVLSTIQKDLVVEKIEKSPIEGICEVIIKLSETEKALFYTDYKGQYIIAGDIIELTTKKNLTLEKLTSLNKRFLKKETLAELEKVVAFTWGEGENTLYFITDPDCPFCKQAETILEELVKTKKLTVKVILFPLEAIHPEAKAKVISIICDQKGYEGLKTGYKSKNQCDIGKQKVTETIALMQKLKIKETPTYIFPDGEIRSGVMSAKAILDKFK